jgi:hypothetical protein
MTCKQCGEELKTCDYCDFQDPVGYITDPLVYNPEGCFMSGEGLNVWGDSLLLELMSTGEFTSEQRCIEFCLLEYLGVPLQDYIKLSGKRKQVKLGNKFKGRRMRLPIILLVYIDKFCVKYEVDRSYVFNMAVFDYYHRRRDVGYSDWVEDQDCVL